MPDMPTPEQIKEWEEVGKPKLEIAVKELSKEELERAAELGGEAAIAEVERRRPELEVPKPFEEVRPTDWKAYIPSEEYGRRRDVILSKLRTVGAPLGVQLDFIKTHRGRFSRKIIQDIKRQLQEYEALKGTEWFEKGVELGLIPKHSIYIDEKSYLPASAVAEIKDTSPKLYGILITEGYAAYESEIERQVSSYEDWQKNHTRLPDGIWMANDVLEGVERHMPDEYEVLRSEGYDAYIELFITVGKDEQMLKSDYDTLSDEYREVLDDKGVIGLQKYIETGILGTTVFRLDEIASSTFLEEGGSVSERIALEGAMRRADIVYPGVVTFRDLPSEDKQKVAENYIPPKGIPAIAGEAEYELKKLREKVFSWSESEIPAGITTIKQLDEIASHDFTKLGWSAGDRIALENTMRRMGIKDPGVSTYRTLSPEDKQKVVDNFTYETLAVEMLKPVEEWTAEANEAMADWAFEDENVARKIAKAIPIGLAEMVLGITVGVGGAVLKSTNDLVLQNPKTAVTQLSNVPLGVAEWLTVHTPTRIEKDPAAGIAMFVGNLALPFVIPGLKGVVGGTKSGYRIAQTLYRKGALPRGLKGGGLDVYKVRVPEAFERIAKELAAKEGDYLEIMRTVSDPALQKARVRALLSPEVAPAFDAMIVAIEGASKFKPTPEMIREVNFGDIPGIPKSSEVAVKAWFQKNPDAIVGGSFADHIQTKGLKWLASDSRGLKRIGDLDVTIPKGRSFMDTVRVAEELTNIIKKTSDVLVDQRSMKVFINNKEVITIHRAGVFDIIEPWPYGWSELKPFTTEGIKFVSLGEQMFRRGRAVLKPGEAEMKGLLGKEVFEGEARRAKDPYRLMDEMNEIANIFERQGAIAEAIQMREALSVTFEGRAATAEPLPPTPKQLADIRLEFIDLVARLQEKALNRGIDVSLEHPLGTLYRYITPQGLVLRGTVYHATTDIRPYIRAIKEKGYIEAGRYIDEFGKWQKAERPDLFTSPDLAFDRLYDLYGGKIPAEAGVVAIRTVAGDIGRGKAVDPTFRTEPIQEVGKAPYDVVYDELRFMEGSRAYATDPTGFSFRKGSVSEGLTGELATYHTRAKTPVNVLFFATEEAKRVGLSAPSAAQVHSINLMAIKAVIGDLWHPHLPKRFVATTEPIKGAALIEFWRDTYKWKGKSKTEVAKAELEQRAELIKEATDNLKAKGKDRLSLELEEQYRQRLKDAKTPEEVANIKRIVEDLRVREYAKALDEELARVSSKKAIEMLSNKEVQRLLKDVTTDEISRTYYYNLQEIYSKIAAVGLGGAGATDITKVTNADITTLPTFASRVTPTTFTPLVPTLPGVVTPTVAKEAPTVSIITLPKPTPPIEVVTPTISITPTEKISPIEKIPPTTVVEPTKIKESVTPITPVRPIKIVTPTTTLITPTEPITPVTPTTPITPTKPTTPITPVTPVTPVTKVTPIVPVTPVEIVKPVVPPTTLIRPRSKTKERRRKIPEGSIAWRQGMLKVRGELKPVWKYIRPPWTQEKPITLLAPPVGAKYIHLRTPKETIQMIGEPEAEVPRTVSVDLGVVDILITDYGKNIEFTGDGLETIVGERINVPEKGLSIPAKELRAYEEEELGIEVERAPTKRRRLTSRDVTPELSGVSK